MLQTSALRRPFGHQTLIYNWLEERADIKNERVQKPLPSQVYSNQCSLSNHRESLLV